MKQIFEILDSDAMKTKEKSSVTPITEEKSHNYSQSSPASNNLDGTIIAHNKRKINNFNINLFDEVKKLFDIKYVLEVYGVQANAKGYAYCPFHQEKTPSFKIYDNSFYCFGCGVGGDIITFVMKYFNLTNIEAARKLNTDFNLNLLDRSSAATHRISTAQIQSNKKLLANFKEWEKQAFITLASYYKALRFWGKQLYVNQIAYFSKYLNALEDIYFVEVLVDVMIENTNDLESQIEFYRSFGEAVTLIEHKYTRLCGTAS